MPCEASGRFYPPVDLIFPGNSSKDEATKHWLQESYRAAELIASICSGTAAMGEAGLLHERRCTTHWEFTSGLQACYPTAQVLEGVLYVQDRRITTSAGVTAGIDMALWLLGQEYRTCATIATTAEVLHDLV